MLEGWVDPRERELEGPFGDHTGYYSLARDYPVFHLTAVTRRARPIYPTTIVGRPPQEDYWLGKATERIFLPIMRLMLPGDRRREHAGRGRVPQPRDRLDPQALSRATRAR